MSPYLHRHFRPSEVEFMKMDIHYAPTPNGWKITILLEELSEAGVDVKYDLVPVNLRKGDQFKENYLRISPNGRMPAMEDFGEKDLVNGTDSLTIFESGAMLIYLGEKYDMFYPKEKSKRFKVLEWLFWVQGGLGPMAGQSSHFVNYAPHVAPEKDHSYSLNRYQTEYNRLFSVMDGQLAKHKYLACDEITIADFAAFPWVLPYKRLGGKIDEFPNLRRWYDLLVSRPAVRRGLDVLRTDTLKDGGAKMSKEELKTMFQKAKM